MQAAPEADFGFPSYYASNALYASSDDNLGYRYLVIPAADEPGEPDVYVVPDGTNDASTLFAVPSQRGSSRAVENGHYDGPVPHARWILFMQLMTIYLMFIRIRSPSNQALLNPASLCNSQCRIYPTAKPRNGQFQL